MTTGGSKEGETDDDDDELEQDESKRPHVSGPGDDDLDELKEGDVLGTVILPPREFKRRKVPSQTEILETVPVAGISGFANTVSQSTNSLAQLEQLLTVESQPPSDSPSLTEGEVGLEMEDVQGNKVQAESTPARTFSRMANLDHEKLELQVQKELEAMSVRMAVLKQADSDPLQPNKLTGNEYEFYCDKFSENPFEALGKILRDDKTGPTKAIELLSLLVNGARQECVMANPEPSFDLKAKLKALEEVEAIVRSIYILEGNNCRYSKAEYAKKLAKINVVMEKWAGDDPQKKEAVCAFTTQMSGLLNRHRYLEGGKKRSFDTSTAQSTPTADDSPFKRFIYSTHKNIKISHSENGNVVHLSFTYDREKVLKGKESEIEKMRNQVNAMLKVAMTEYNKGSDEKNAIMISNRPPSLNQPELGIAMLEMIKLSAIKEQREIFVADPNDPSKIVKFTPTTQYTDAEKKCMEKFYHDVPTGGKGKTIAQARGIEDVHQKINDDLTKIVGKVKEASKEKVKNAMDDHKHTAAARLS